MKYFLGISKFLEESFPVYCFPLFLWIHHWGRLSYLFLLFFGTLHSDAYIFPFLLFASLLFTTICKASPDSHFAFLHFFLLGMFLIITTCCTMSWTSVHSSSGTLSDLIPWIYLSFPLYNLKWFDLGYTWMVSPTFFNISLNLARRSSWSEPQSAPSIVFADCIELLHLWLQRI